MRQPLPKRRDGPRTALRVRSRGARCTVGLKRAYEAPSASDGMRVLVDRLWPRGLTMEQVAADLWLRELAPSDALRRWFDHEPSRWIAFSQKYRAELAGRPDLLRLLDELRRSARLTLVYSGGDAEHNHAVVLEQLVSERRFASHDAEGVET